MHALNPGSVLLHAGCLKKDLQTPTVDQSADRKLPAQLILTHCLLAHSALVCVPGGLVVVGVRDETSTHPQQSEGLDLQVCRVSVRNQRNLRTQNRRAIAIA